MYNSIETNIAEDFSNFLEMKEDDIIAAIEEETGETYNETRHAKLYDKISHGMFNERGDYDRDD